MPRAAVSAATARLSDVILSVKNLLKVPHRLMFSLWKINLFKKTIVKSVKLCILYREHFFIDKLCTKTYSHVPCIGRILASFVM